MKARQIMSADDVRRALVRIGHEIVERHGGTSGLALVGIRRRGDVLATRLASIIAELTAVDGADRRARRVGLSRRPRPARIDPDAAGSIPERPSMPFDVPRYDGRARR